MDFYRFRRFIASVALSLISLIATVKPSSAQTILDTVSCGYNSTIDLGSVIAGGTLQHPLSLFDHDSTVADSVFALSGSSDSGISWTPMDSITLHYQQTAHVTTIIYSRPTPGFDTTFLVLTDSHNSSCFSTYRVIGEAVGPDTDNAVIPLIHTSHNIIAFKSDTTELLHIQLLNNGPAITFDSLQLDSATAFRIDLSSITFPYTLDSGASFPLKLSFSASNPGFYTDFISMPGEPILPLSVQGLLLPKDAVQTQPANSTYFWFYPNPAQGPVMIHTENLMKAHLTITDVLGRTEREASFQSDWQWDRQTEGGSFVLAGTYFLIITGVDGNGNAVHRVERIILE